MNLRAHLTALPPVQVIYTDLDGTLLGRGGSVLADAEGAPSLAAVQALVDARRAGVAVVAVSGRQADQLRENVRLLGLDAGIAEAGAVHVDPREVAGEEVVREYLWGAAPADVGTSPRSALEAAGALAVVTAAFPDTIRPYRPWDTGREGGYILQGRLDVEEVNAALEEAEIGWAHVVDNGVTEGWPELGEVRAYHLLCRGVGKAAGVRADLARRGLPPAAALAVGDSAEDATMADEVGTYVSVGPDRASAGLDNAFRASASNGRGVAEVIAAVLAARGRP